jgi:hypothetical protein
MISCGTPKRINTDLKLEIMLAADSAIIDRRTYARLGINLVPSPFRLLITPLTQHLFTEPHRKREVHKKEILHHILPRFVWDTFL